ncbi:MAG TPA: ABC transporter ATP-binding protein, partial [Polyangia bacterium]|nr:ABC transporter ATP-binding protein [Polyangia bacterium]
DPKVLLLDEPTLGLDPKGARDLRAFLREEIIRGAGRTAIVCSNDPTEARAMADRVLFLDGGRLQAEAPPDRIEAELGL